MIQEYKLDRYWADSYLPEIERVVKLVAPKIIELKIAPEQDDMSKATDYLVTVETGTIACRIRRSSIRFRDFTIRSSRASGAKTELEKIKDGFGRWYIYAWVKNNHIFDRAIIVDLNKLRKSGILNNHWSETENKDGETKFIAIPLSVLFYNNCIVEDINQCDFVGQKGVLQV